MKGMPSFQGEEKTSKYHGAFLYVQRLDNILRDLDDVHIYRETELDAMTVKKTISKNYALLKIFFSEIIGRLTEKERKEFVGMEKPIKILYKQFISKYKKKERYDLEFLEDFDDWERELRIIADQKGLIMPDKEVDTGL